MKAEILLRENFEKGIPYPSKIEEIARFAEDFAHERMEQQMSVLTNLLTKPTEALKPFEKWYRKENPLADGAFYLPDSTKFYTWIAKKLESYQASTKTQKLLDLCHSRNLHCSISWQRVTGYSVEIYTGYKSDYSNLFFTDGHTKPKKAVKEALKFIKKYDEQKSMGLYKEKNGRHVK